MTAPKVAVDFAKGKALDLEQNGSILGYDAHILGTSSWADDIPANPASGGADAGTSTTTCVPVRVNASAGKPESKYSRNRDVATAV